VVVVSNLPVAKVTHFCHVSLLAWGNRYKEIGGRRRERETCCCPLTMRSLNTATQRAIAADRTCKRGPKRCLIYCLRYMFFSYLGTSVPSRVPQMCSQNYKILYFYFNR
jgi:hypothetical protein